MSSAANATALVDLLRSADSRGWPAALHHTLRRTDRVAYRRATDLRVANWRVLLPISCRGNVLQLNAGLGGAAFCLARTGATVVAANSSAEPARVIARRAAASHGVNVRSVQAGLGQALPFGPRTFDVVVLVDALGGVPPPLQAALLRQVREVLRDDGVLLVADGNRRSPLHWLVAFTRAHGMRSSHGYQRVLGAAGFRDTRAWGLIPSHLEPFFLVPLDAGAPLEYFLTMVAAHMEFGPQIQIRGRSPRWLYSTLRWIVRAVPERALSPLVAALLPGVAVVGHA
jgi:SAM-dependent methyltransferase